MTSPMWSEAKERLDAATAAYGEALDAAAQLRAHRPAEKGAKREQWRRDLAKAQDDLKKARAAFRAASDALLEVQEHSIAQLHMQAPW